VKGADVPCTHQTNSQVHGVTTQGSPRFASGLAGKTYFASSRVMASTVLRRR
jgi:hypothetical protein